MAVARSQWSRRIGYHWLGPRSESGHPPRRGPAPAGRQAGCLPARSPGFLLIPARQTSHGVEMSDEPKSGRRGPRTWSSVCPGRPVGVDRTRAPGANWEKRSAGVVSRGCLDAPFNTRGAHERNGRGGSAGGFRRAACCCMRLSQSDDLVRLSEAHIWSAVSRHPRIPRLGRTRQRGRGHWHGHGALQQARPHPG
jgi:hypothetical protein